LNPAIETLPQIAQERAMMVLGELEVILAGRFGRAGTVC
jgi:hypothetical protein